MLHEKNYDELDKYISGLVHLRAREMESLSQKIHDPVLAAFIMSKYDRAAEQKVDLILTDRTELQCELSEEMQQDMVVITGNLLENAFDAVQGCAMRIVTLEIRESAGDIMIAVWDSGMEIPQELREVLFDYGVTSKENGNGIGLHLVRQACGRDGGYVSVVSDAQSGTEFVAHIPYHTKEDGVCTDALS